MSESELQRKKSKSSRELNAVLTITARDILLTFKSPGSLLTSFLLPIVMMGMLGGSLAQNISGSLGFNYSTYMLVGMLVNMLFMITTMGLMSLVEDRQTNFTQEMMISPVSRYSIVIGKILGSTFAAVVEHLALLSENKKAREWRTLAHLRFSGSHLFSVLVLMAMKKGRRPTWIGLLL